MASSAFRDPAVEQIVRRERRDRVSQLTRGGERRHDSRRRVNSNVMSLHPNTVRIFFPAGIIVLATGVAHGQDQEKTLGNPITREQILELDGPGVVRKFMPAYPEIAAARRINGQVLIDVEINPKGNVTAARVIIGEKLLRDSARKAALLWQFKSVDTVATRSVRLTFVFLPLDYVAPKEKPVSAAPYRVEIERVAMP